MENNTLLSKEHIIRTMLFVIWQTACAIFFHVLHIHDTWPAFFVAIFFFAFGLDVSRLKEIFCGAISGLIFGYFIPIFFTAMTPVVGSDWSLFLYIALAIFIITFFGPVAHTLLNPVSFMYALLCLLNVEKVSEHAVQWGIIMLLGGGLLAGGIYLSAIFVEKYISKSPAESEMNME